MRYFHKISSLRPHLQSLRTKGKSIGLVPTMGALHDGHKALIRQSKDETDVTVVSIFVNPTQFNNQKDFDGYPIRLDDDKAILEALDCDILFHPDQMEIYPQEPILNLNFGTLEQVMEGEFRPGHFKGVGLIVAKLLNIVAPDVAFFGQKDLQQCAIVQQMAKDMCFATKIKIVPTVRANSGLALSSRNLLLSAKQQQEASIIYKQLKEAAAKYMSGIDQAIIKKDVNKYLEDETNLNLEYFEIVDGVTMLPIDGSWHGNSVALCMAAYLGDVRLIDNILLKGEE